MMTDKIRKSRWVHENFPWTGTLTDRKVSIVFRKLIKQRGLACSKKIFQNFPIFQLYKVNL